MASEAVHVALQDAVGKGLAQGVHTALNPSQLHIFTQQGNGQIKAGDAQAGQNRLDKKATVQLGRRADQRRQRQGKGDRRDSVQRRQN